MERWEPYRKSGYLHRPQTIAQYLAAVNQVVGPMLIDVLKDNNFLNVRDIRTQIAEHITGKTTCFDQNNSSTSKDNLVVEAIERITCICYALEQQQLMQMNDSQNADQIVVDTLNLEGPHLNRLATLLNGFTENFWPSHINQACCEYVEGRVELNPNLTFRGNGFTTDPIAWEPEQLRKTINI
ncbi:MAG: hypothetical protein WD335_04065 [Candidatus Paceibacterota bacterium]